MHSLDGSSFVIGPMGVGEVLDAGIWLARRHYRLLLLVAAWVEAPAYLLSTVLSLTVDRPPNALDETFLGFLFNPGALASAPTNWTWLICYPAIAVACATAVEQPDAARELRPAAVFARVARRLPMLLALTVVMAIAAVPLLIVLPLGIFVLVRWSMAWLPVLTQNANARDALATSWRITKGSWWHTCFVLTAWIMFTLISGFAAGALFAGAGYVLATATGDDALFIALDGAGGLASILTTPFSGAVLVVLFYELRARSQGFDLLQRARAVGVWTSSSS